MPAAIINCRKILLLLHECTNTVISRKQHFPTEIVVLLRERQQRKSYARKSSDFLLALRILNDEYRKKQVMTQKFNNIHSVYLKKEKKMVAVIEVYIVLCDFLFSLKNLEKKREKARGSENTETESDKKNIPHPQCII